jgi:betaine-aldehyde dehydrogenase
MVELLGQRTDELVALHIGENGVTVRQAMAFHVGYAIAHLQYFADLAGTYAFERPGPLMGYPTAAAGVVRREPIGVVAGIVPWNFPLLLAVWKLGPALAAGNCIVLKPDEKTPATLLELARAAEEAGLPRGVLNVITGVGEEVGARLAAHPDVRKIAFTGSTAVGREVAKLASQNVKRVTLGLGGKGPNIVLADADLDTAVDGALFACCLYQGQACESGTRLLLPDPLHDTFVARLVERAAAIRVGDPTDFETDVGPIISAEQRDRIEKYIALGVEEGASIAFQGTTLEGPGYWVAPTILTGVTNDMRVARDEIFGPVLCVLRYSTVDEAVSIANDTEYGLSAGVWSEDVEAALEVAARLESGTVWINDWHMVNALYPFGGFKQSGLGRELGPDSLDEYTEEKFVHIDLSRSRDRRVFDLVVPRGEASK